MAKILVVSDQSSLAGLAASLLKARASKKLREEAMERIRAANPTVDLDHLEQGRILVIPALEGERGQPTGATPRMPLGDAKQMLSDVLAGVEASNKDRVEEAKATRNVLTSPAVKRLAEQDEVLKESLVAWKESAAADEESARREQESFKAAVAAWTDDLEVLRTLTGES